MFFFKFTFIEDKINRTASELFKASKNCRRIDDCRVLFVLILRFYNANNFILDWYQGCFGNIENNLFRSCSFVYVRVRSAICIRWSRFGCKIPTLEHIFEVTLATFKF